MFDNNNFYPTPRKLIDKMLSDIDFKMIQSVLEPNAGKGDIVEEVKKQFKYSRSGYYRNEKKWDIDCIEIDKNLQYILQGENNRVVHDDFLTYNTYKKYDLIVMNPPFDNGEKHLLKAIEMQEQGGQIVCILNAETLKNPYSNTRKDLLNKLEQYNAKVEFIENAFVDADRKTSVEIALIKINIPKIEYNSTILGALKQEEEFEKTKRHYNSNQVVEGDFINGIIERYNFEVKAGLRLIDEYEQLKPLMLGSFKEKYGNAPVLKLSLWHDDPDGNCSIKNAYIKQIRMKYWKALFESKEFMGMFTSNLKSEYMNKINELRDYDFSLYNIQTIRIQLNKELIKGVEDTILSLFKEFSHKHYYEETSKNIHYYNGWKTNKAYKINKKIIIPLSAYNNLSNELRYDYKVVDKLTDIEKVFNYLDNGKTKEMSLEKSLKFAENYGETKKIELKYFYVTFYKKGTCHIEFKNMELLHKFNLFGSQRKGWLPPSYGKSKYNDMTQEEKSIIDEFEGSLSYNKVIKNKDYYIVENENLLLLSC